MNVRIENSWQKALAQQWDEPYFVALTDFVRQRYADPKITVYPPAKQIFAAFDQCPFSHVKVVIIGQDPYHGPGQANGLCFSVNNGVPLPPSLLNIFKEIKDDLSLEQAPTDGDLSRWARQGVLLLNATLTVDAHCAASHQGKGWERFTDEVIMKLNNDKNNIVFILWGSYAIKKGAFIDRSRHCVITSAHPSPLSAYRGFFGSKPFSKTNKFLIEHNISPIDWR
ncbi:MAG: uracil-DNA glycosylase [Muribaculum sp.]|nr:uracil-DNA glycosylase [Muribaculaceae bacterium]MCM1080976.1 uracil-DNA glycosylase [Muribaculum sp.]